MRIGLFTDTFLPIVDGVGRVVYHYADTVCKKGHDCTVIAPRTDTCVHDNCHAFELLDFYGMPLPSSPQYKIGFPTLDRKYVLRINKANLDIVHTHSPFIAGKEALRISKKFKLPLVGTFHSKYYDDFYKITGNEELASIGVRYVVDFYKKCDEVWVVSKASGEVLRSYGYKGEYTVMPNGADIKEPDPSAASEVTRQFELGSDPVLLFVGQMNWKKNILSILEACAMLKAEIPFTLVLAGQGPDADEIKTKADTLGLGKRVLFPGHIADNRVLDGLYQRASLFVFPSLYDNAPMVVREAAVMGTPSVMIKGSSAAEVIQNGVNGLLCDDDSNSLSDIIRMALSDPIRLEAMGQNARNTIPVSWDTIMDDALLHYENLILAKQRQLEEKAQRKLARLARHP